MQFTEHGQQLIIDAVRLAPLGPLEYRRVEGLGPLYVARDDAVRHPGFPWIMKLAIDGDVYRLCWRNLNSEDGIAAPAVDTGDTGRIGPGQTRTLKLVK